MKSTNVTYKKIYDNGILTNPITKDTPFISGQSADKRKVRIANNRKGNGVVIAKIGPMAFMRYNIVKQFTGHGVKRLGVVVHAIMSK